MRGIRKKTVHYVVITLSVSAVLLCGVFATIWFLSEEICANYEMLLQEKNSVIEQNTKTVFVALQDVGRGEVVTEEMLTSMQVFSSQDSSLYFSEEDFGKAALVDIRSGSFVDKAMVNQSGPVEQLREVCFDGVLISENTKNHDVVDIRIRYSNGEDYVVLSGKQIRLDEGDYRHCYLRVEEEELLLMAAALVDADCFEGAVIYTTKYIESSIQEKSEVTYLPSEVLLELMEQSPNVLAFIQDDEVRTLRKALEERLQEIGGRESW